MSNENGAPQFVSAGRRFLRGNISMGKYELFGIAFIAVINAQ